MRCVKERIISIITMIKINMYLKYLPQVILPALPPALALLICTFPSENRLELVFTPDSINLLQIYSSNYTHFSPLHCLSNVTLYSLFILAAYIVFRSCREEGIFWISFVACLLLVPLISAISWMLVALTSWILTGKFRKSVPDFIESPG